MKYDLELIQHVNLFEKITKAHVKDCFPHNNLLVFVVKQGEASQAVGKQGANVRKLSDMTKKRIKIVEFNEDPVKFIRSFIAPIKVEEIEQEDKIITIKASSTKDKGLLIGRDSRNLINLKKITQKYYDIEDIKIA